MNSIRVLTLTSWTLVATAVPGAEPAVYDAPQTTTGASLKTQVFVGNKPLADAPPFPDFSLQDPYTRLEGVTTFRGGPRRDSPSWGHTRMTSGTLEVAWRYRTLGSKWGGGAAWTGQPVVVRWPAALRKMMNLRDPFRNQNGFTEVIQGSTSGHIYFLDLATGKPTRDPITVGNPVKGSVSIDPRGIPLLFVGEGIKENGPMGLNIYSLLDGSRLWRMPGLDANAPKGWDAMDPAGLVDAGTDTLIQAAENGLLYGIRLGTVWDSVSGSLSITPEPVKYRYTAPRARRGGIESSPAVDRNLIWFADNGGTVQAVNWQTMSPVWAAYMGDDTDASVVVERGADGPWIYAGSEVDLQGSSGLCRIRRFHGLDGAQEWERTYSCRSVLGERPVNGGMLATPILGKGLLDDLIIVSVARYRNLNDGLLTALDRRTGVTVWERTLKNYTWSSPVDFYTKGGAGYLVQGDSGGTLWLLDGSTGDILGSTKLGGIVEASPVFFEDMVIVGTRNNEILGVRVK